ncbi:MAG: 30S ribosome-binding factor RbfA [Actinomycetes bacterium]
MTEMDARARKLADRIHEIVAQTLERRVKDPRLGFVTITDARITNDLRDGTVFYTVYGDETERADTAAALESAKGMLRSEVGKQTGVRFTPTLAFVFDGVQENVRHIEDLLQQAREADAQVHRQAAVAQYAGEPDAYRHPEEETEQL